MKIQVESTLEPLYGKMPGGLRQRIPVIDGYETRLTVQYEVLEPKDGEPALSMRPFIAHSHGAQFQETRFTRLEWMEDDTASVRFYPIGSGYSEVRVFLKGLDTSDVILDDRGTTQQFKGEVDSDEQYRYYCRPFRVYSLHEVLSLFLAGLSILLAGSVLVFTVLLCILTFVLATLTYRLPMVQL